ncbi:hypothetical protein B0J14DRAFT_644426, partial [Halenospora varia]
MAFAIISQTIILIVFLLITLCVHAGIREYSFQKFPILSINTVQLKANYLTQHNSTLDIYDVSNGFIRSTCGGYLGDSGDNQFVSYSCSRPSSRMFITHHLFATQSSDVERNSGNLQIRLRSA